MDFTTVLYRVINKKNPTLSSFIMFKINMLFSTVALSSINCQTEVMYQTVTIRLCNFYNVNLADKLSQG